MKWLIAGVTVLTTISSVLSANTDPNVVAIAVTTPEQLQCEAPSTELLRLGDAYYNLEPERPLASGDIQLLNQFYQRLQGRWVGSLDDNYCSGVGESARMETKAYLLKRVEAELHHKGSLIFKSERHLVEERKGSSRTRSVSIKPSSRMDFWPGNEVSSLQIENENTVTMTSKFRQNNSVNTFGQRLSTFRERQDRLLLSENSLRIETRHFSNGYFTGYEITDLIRR